MKISRYIYLFLLTALFASCQKELDKIKPTGASMDVDQVTKGGELSPEGRLSQIRGALYNNAALYPGYGPSHLTFGYPALACMLDFSGDIAVSSLVNYDKMGRFGRHYMFNSSEGTISNFSWKLFWDNVAECNNLIRMSNEKEELLKSDIHAQARIFRAWSYFNMAQLYGKTYFGNEDAPCIPIVIETTTEKEATNNPRRSVKEIYALIVKDLNQGIDILTDLAKSPATKSQPTKDLISLATAHGIRARVYLLMHEYAMAKNDAQMAINLAMANGIRPMAINECSIPNFDKIGAAPNAMWGLIETDQSEAAKSILDNYTSQMVSFAFGNLAYTTAADQYRRINISLYNQIPESDVRKGWWLDANKNSPLLDVYSQSTIKVNNVEYNALKYIKANAYPYTVAKFAPTNKNINSPINANDFFLMRIEEMYYILAEATFMSGDKAKGVETLVSFVKKYRDPEFEFDTNNEDTFIDQIYFQRRIEFWGEGYSWFDMIRFNKGIVRVNADLGVTNGFATGGRFNIPAGDPSFVFQLPRSAVQRNKALAGNNNPLATDPVEIM